jgi:hypothetical protein
VDSREYKLLIVADTAIHVAQELGYSYMHQGVAKIEDAYIHIVRMLNGADCGG